MAQELDIETFSDYLFYIPKEQPLEISFDLKDSIGDGDDDQKQLFEALILVLTRGFQKLFGNSEGKVDIDNLPPGSIETLKPYFNKIGFELFIDIDTPKARREHSELANNVFTLQTSTRKYFVSFDFISNSQCQ
tara:strand:+ start:966 stop:1367 length:402 start_codon:yes stop_codon:yes gene_type:complete